MIRGVLSNEERHAQMAQAIGRFPLLRRKPVPNQRRISIVCYGPSLRDTWRLVKTPMITVSGAHDFMLARGVTPQFHVECDPREHKCAMLAQPQQGTRYLMASVCHPAWWRKLQGYHVRLWHLINGNDLETPAWVAQHDPQGFASMVGGGSTAGQRAMNVAAYFLGYRRFDIFGMDGSFADCGRHAGEHAGKPQSEILVRAEGRVFRTTPQMLAQANEMQDFLTTTDADCAFYGDGMIQEMARILKRRIQDASFGRSMGQRSVHV